MNFARRLLARKKLQPPIDVLALLEEYADVLRLDIPFDVDGVCIGLKAPGKRPKVFVNNNRSEYRVRFTLAHELGHIIIPWHTGDIVDNTGIRGEINSEYLALEAEANRFASELLMPIYWVNSIVSSSNDVGEIVRRVVDGAKVSMLAATIKVVQALPPHYIVVHNDGGLVDYSDRSPGTVAGNLARGTPISGDHFQYSTKSGKYGGGQYRWWFLEPEEAPVAKDPSGDWRAVLEKIFFDIGVNGDSKNKFRAQLNGILSSANSSARGERSIRVLYGRCIPRLYERAEDSEIFSAFLQHPLLAEFLALRLAAFLK